ncbi:tRNA 2-thiouridine synthesizing protein A [Paracoccus halophilus]|uniref:Preprotein translocase subunit TatB n=1 Tax=Paracoccus halophilus TaxID=376733 RepID=A0A099F6A9_9RHOB|nr:sulfurtransferase TusA family protein [Paracoccus halophilus]KGJ05642.1 preprotein translocase subunit TatB [Paracoccus halophilus]SFA47599.1 tRNA 2-thiouridine synthesizing protein A [Paracoccus halophilus]
MSTRIDARGLLCPLPVLRLRKRLLALPPGSRVTLIATDKAAAIDVPHFCAENGHSLIRTHETAPGETEYTIERGRDA